MDLGLSFDPFSSSHLNLDKLFSLLTGCLWNLMFPLDVYNASFMEVLLELTERFCRGPQKFCQEMINIAIIASVHLLASQE